MSKNFTEAEDGGYKGIGCHVPQPKPRFSFVSKKLRSRTVSYLFCMCPMAFSSFLIFMSMYVTDPGKFCISVFFESFLLWSLSFMLKSGE